MNKRVLFTTLLACTSLFAASHFASAACGRGAVISKVAALGGDMVDVTDVNNSSSVVGSSKLPGANIVHAFLFRGGSQSLDLGSFGRDSVANAINASGQVAGYSVQGFEFRAFIWNEGAGLQSIGTLGGTQSYAEDINDAGQVVGWSSTVGEGTVEAFIYENGVMRGLGHLPAGTTSRAWAVNNHGVIVGDSDSAVGVRAFICTAAQGSMTSLGTLSGISSSAKAVNDSSQVVGDSTTAAGDTHAFLYRNGVLQDLGTLGGNSSSAAGINNLGQVVGTSTTAGGASRAFLWQEGTMTDLNTLLPQSSGWILETASSITDNGIIVGMGILNGTQEGFVLSLGAGAENTPPQAVVDRQLATAQCSSSVTLDGSGSFDPDGDVLNYSWTYQGQIVGAQPALTMSYPPGQHTLVMTVTDPCGASSSISASVVVQDTTAPAITAATATPSVLSPPNHKPVTVQVQVDASDNCDPSPTSRIVRITSNQPLAPGEARITGDLTVSLAATRSPAGGARVYSLHLVTVDASGNAATDTVTVIVPKGSGNAGSGK